MSTRDPLVALPTHDVANVARPLEDYDMFASDAALREATAREGGSWVMERAAALGRVLGTAEVLGLGTAANRFGPELRSFDRFGRRIDEVDFHPSYHRLMQLAIEAGIPSVAWSDPRPGGHVAHAALTYLFTQAEAGVLCPMAMTYAAVPALRAQPDVAAEWVPRITAAKYDPRCVPASEKAGVTFGMAMTEKQGGSDVRANTTRARALGKPGPGEAYALTGHKWFCSAPMSDAFLTLAQTERGLTCFLVPRFRPDGTRNNFFIQRLKDKLGNKSNASSEIEYADTWAQMIGEEGRGVSTIIEMVHHTRIGAAVGPAGMMRHALANAINHCDSRAAFGKRLIDQPLMRVVLADLAIEVEAATTLVMRVARAFDESTQSGEARAFARLATAATKYWVNKRAPGVVVEALECHGGAGYVEESPMPRLYREAPLNGIWEGSGNVICLDVLRTLHREPQSLEAVMAEVRGAVGEHKRLGEHVRQLEQMLSAGELEARARELVQGLAVALQAALLVRHAPPAIADAFCRTRLVGEPPAVYGKLPMDVDVGAIIERARVPLA